MRNVIYRLGMDKTEEYCNMVFEEADLNNDGKIDFDEFCLIINADNKEDIIKLKAKK